MPTTKKKDDLLEQQNQVPNTTQQTAPAQSSTVQQAQTMLQQQMKNGYQSQWQPQINNLMEQYMNRDKFSYDVNKDALFQQLRDQYKLMGQQAMMDTMGQATALTGGYGNSYAQGVGQQAYQGFMQQLGDKMPDLYQLALDQYINEGSKMQGDIAMMMQQDSLDYGRYRDQMADQEDAYNKLVALMTNYHYEPTAEEMAAAGMPEAHKNAIMKPYYDMLAEQAAASSGNSSDYDSIIATQQMLKDAGYDITVDGVWSQETQDAWNMYQAGIVPNGSNGYYDQLLGAVSTAKGEYSKQTWTEKQKAYQESSAAINEAYNSGKITEEEKKTLLKIATPGSR